VWPLLDDNFTQQGPSPQYVADGAVDGCTFRPCFADISGMYQFEADAYLFEKTLARPVLLGNT
jgi:hypothetical protein